ncbi:hypothetical protein A2V49_00595 [candidate division WWE3 bacterium RBG_19FT_COMBO_34_6]|uniref:DUF5652 domain-containing protein n=1 Tax=candidate division WWE3 bacterium RBG_19FT_COMBO_34_6 TaxID=1802612 RepID=A0A1F4UNH2_UNCKA|nr:MAG: hypothetical protein A2V49_00595 [candidate division WWE3 bacterium RBG_19FT_COMBO_34_6]
MQILEFLALHPEIYIPLAIWDLVWKAIALWTSAKNDQKYWFVALLIINSIGILPITYLIIDKNKKGSVPVKK